MVTRVRTLLVDDLDGLPADETVSFALDGREYEVDLSKEHAEALRSALRAYAKAGRQVGGKRGRGRPRK